MTSGSRTTARAADLCSAAFGSEASLSWHIPLTEAAPEYSSLRGVGQRVDHQVATSYALDMQLAGPATSQLVQLTVSQHVITVGTFGSAEDEDRRVGGSSRLALQNVHNGVNLVKITVVSWGRGESPADAIFCRG